MIGAAEIMDSEAFWGILILGGIATVVTMLIKFRPGFPREAVGLMPLFEVEGVGFRWNLKNLGKHHLALYDRFIVLNQSELIWYKDVERISFGQGLVPKAIFIEYKSKRDFPFKGRLVFESKEPEKILKLITPHCVNAELRLMKPETAGDDN